MAMNLQLLAEAGFIASDWAEALAPVEGQLAELGRFLNEERASGQRVLPAGERILAAFQRPLAEVRVLIVGQDPYPTLGHPIGLSFATAPDVLPIPRSLQNIYRELRDDLSIEPAPQTIAALAARAAEFQAKAEAEAAAAQPQPAEPPKPARPE